MLSTDWTGQIKQEVRQFDSALHEKAKDFYALHHKEAILLLPNAWDALSAKIYEKEGAKAIATTSAGIAAVFGYPDGQLPKELLFTMIERITQSVRIPVTVDLEDGYGETPEEVCQNVLEIVKRGAVGLNIEDADPKHPGNLIPLDKQVAKIRAIKTLVQTLDVPIFVNARTDIFWLKLFKEEERLAEALTRLAAYKQAGADGLFVPGLTDFESISTLSRTLQLPLNILAGPWISDLLPLNAIGVSRVTMGSSGIRDCASHLQRQTRQYLAGKYMLSPDISYEQVNALFK